MNTSMQHTRRAATVPQATGWPVVGNLPGLLRQGLGYVAAQQSQLGDLYRIKAGPQAMVLLNHPEHARHVLLNNADNYVKEGTFWSSVRSLIGLGLPTLEGETWRVRRRMMNPQFHHTRLRELGRAMVDTIESHAASWPTDTPINAARCVSRITMAVIVRTMFGADLAADQADTVARAMSFSLDHMLQRVVTDALPSWIPVPGRRAHREAVEQIDQVLFSLIEQRRSQRAQDDNLLTMLLEMRDDAGSGLDDQQLRDETMSLFIAGYETTAASVSWGLARMAQQPELYAYVADEVDAVLGGRLPTPDDLPQLRKTTRFFFETLRLDGPVFILPRVAQHDDRIDGRPIPAGTVVSLMLDRIHRHPEAWDTPEVFDPDRFLDDRSQGRHPCAFIPFGAGRRQCIGKAFATMEGVFLLAMLVQRFRLAPAAGMRWDTQIGITRRPRDGIRLRLTARR